MSGGASTGQNAAPGPISSSNSNSTTAAAPSSAPADASAGNATGAATTSSATVGGLTEAPPDTAGDASPTPTVPSATGSTKVPTNIGKAGPTVNAGPDLTATPDVGNGTNPVQPANSGPPPSTATATNPNGPRNAVSPPGTLPTTTDGTENPPATVNAPVMVALQPDAPPTEPRTTTTSDTGHDDKGKDSGIPTDASAAAAPAPDPQQPVAAVIVVSAEATVQGPAPTLAEISAAPAAIGGSSKPPVQATLPVDADQDGAPTQDAAGGAQDAQTPAGNNADATAKPASAATVVTANAADTASQPAALAQGSDDAAGPALPEANAANGSGHSNAPAATPSTLSSSEAGASNGQSGSGAAKVTADGLPNFGFAVATSAAPSAPATTAAPASTAAIPIAGLAVAIAARAQSGSNQFEIRLDPPELGRIDVHLDVDRDGQVTSHVTADRADTLALLQSQQPQLERALEQAGLKTADNGLQFTLRDQSLAGQNNNGGGSQPQVAQLVIPDSNLAPVDAAQIYTRAGLGGGLDIRV